MPGVQGDQKKPLNHLEQKLQMVFGCHLDVGT